MKNLSLLIAAIFIAAVFSANATIYTVSNAVGITAQYSTIDAAVAAASNGDTLYVNGSATVYSMSTLTKQLTIIGIGYNPAAPDLTPTQISGVTVQADNVSFIGIKFTSSLTYSGTRNNVKIERCYFNNTQLLLGSNGNTANTASAPTIVPGT